MLDFVYFALFALVYLVQLGSWEIVSIKKTGYLHL